MVRKLDVAADGRRGRPLGASAADEAELVAGDALLTLSGNAKHRWAVHRPEGPAGVSGELELLADPADDPTLLARSSCARPTGQQVPPDSPRARRAEHDNRWHRWASFLSGPSSTTARVRGRWRTLPPSWSPSLIPPLPGATAASVFYLSPWSRGATSRFAGSKPPAALSVRHGFVESAPARTETSLAGGRGTVNQLGQGHRRRGPCPRLSPGAQALRGGSAAVVVERPPPSAPRVLLEGLEPAGCRSRRALSRTPDLTAAPRWSGTLRAGGVPRASERGQHGQVQVARAPVESWRVQLSPAPLVVMAGTPS